MLSHKFITFLKKDLPKLVDADIISEYQAESILYHYQTQWKAKRRVAIRLALIWLGIIVGSCILFWLLPIFKK